jgi:hypothetical protein
VNRENYRLIMASGAVCDFKHRKRCCSSEKKREISIIWLSNFTTAIIYWQAPVVSVLKHFLLAVVTSKMWKIERIHIFLFKPRAGFEINKS